MSRGGRSLQAMAVLALAGVMSYYAITAPTYNLISVSEGLAAHTEKDNAPVRLCLWYEDNKLTDYLDSVCNSYFEETGVRVVPRLYDGVDYFGDMSRASGDDDIPDADLFVARSSDIELAVMNDIISPIEESIEPYYDVVALNAVTYKGDVMGYPLSYDTSFMVSNRTYIEEYAKDQIEAVRAQEAADEADTGEEPVDTKSATSQEIADMVSELMPRTMYDLESFADDFNAPENVTNVILWDGEDIFYNYFVLGSVINLGGKCGDDESVLDIRGRDSVSALKSYKEITEFFSLSDEQRSYGMVRDAFANGELVFAIASTDIVSAIDEKKGSEDISWEYDIESIYDICEGIPSKPLSVTECICINGDNEGKKQWANDFARYMIDAKKSQLFFDKTKRLMAGRDAVKYLDDDIKDKASKAYSCYLDSTPAIKLMSRSDYWMKLELCLERVKDGADIQIMLQNLERELQD